MTDLKNYTNNIQLIKVGIEELEELRIIRNKASSDGYTFFNKYISKKMQQEWFNKLNHKKNIYFLIKHFGITIGIAQITEINTTFKTCEAGLYITSSRFIDTYIPAIVSLKICKIVFNKLNLTFIYARIKKNNAKAIIYNKSLGFTDYSVEKDGIKLELHRNKYHNKLLPILVKLGFMSFNENRKI